MSEGVLCDGNKAAKTAKPREEPEVCWEEMYRNDSRKWILRDGTTTGSVKVSTVKDSYRFPEEKSLSPLLGRRARIIREQFLKEAEQEVQMESNKPPEIEDYITSYDCDYRTTIPGFVPQYEIKKNPELFCKYPLYASHGMTYWRFQHEKGFGNPTQIPGQTVANNIDNPFKRNSNFSKPITEKDGDVSH
ncbi:PREDICTED: uncharacterized protein LOC108563699 [Nicrophorus vespilloides]|uniref:Uncharacterized protein LOC108563699 n=1 Tax=Nicrophorus vespilloides TaxID=110193 RepID=A0ABM1MTP1_NICVS|nr:PREDICTED: uncharacterized protein LOC108563699 [Nicrophorus vespilloides]